MTLSSHAKLMCGILLVIIPTIEFGGYFLLRILSGKFDHAGFTEFQKSVFRAGHAHAGVLVILAIICQVLTDEARLGSGAEWLVRIGLPAAALLISGGFFGSAAGKGATRPNGMVSLIYAGIFLLALCLIILAVGLFKAI